MCTSWLQIEPSPAAEATRLTLLARTSPAANTPGRLVSYRNGGRRSGQPAAAAASSSAVRSGEVRAGLDEAPGVERDAEPTVSHAAEIEAEDVPMRSFRVRDPEANLVQFSGK